MTPQDPQTPLTILRVPALQDNYIWLVHEPESEATAVVDPAEAGPVMEALEARGWRLTHVLNTHHHNDHTGGNRDLKRLTGATIIGPRADRERIPEIDLALGEGDGIALGRHRARVFDIPGHTKGHIAYWFEEDRALFCGDTLFILGCGKVFEGTWDQMWASLAKLRALPPETRIYCAHEYTQANARFALAVDPDNPRLIERSRSFDALRRAGDATVPGLLGDELSTNPFLRADEAAFLAVIGLEGRPPAEVFGALRERKNGFR